MSLEASFAIGSWRVNVEHSRIQNQQLQKHLDPKVMQLLVYLMENRDKVVSRNELLDELWQDQIVADDVLNVAISNLRKALNDDARAPTYIKTVPRKGYQLIAPIEAVPAKGQSIAVNWYVVLALVIAFLAVFWVAFDSGNNEKFVAPETIETQRIAVLPFDYYAVDKERAYIAEGVTQTLINRLAQFANLQVVSHASSLQLKASEKSIADIAKELNVDLVLKGAVQIEGDQIQLSAQLISTENDVQIWSEAKQFKLNDLLASQNAFSVTIANALQDFYKGSHKLVIEKSEAIPADAYDSFLRGQYYHYQGDGDLAIAAFEKAVELHPNYALAYAHLSHSYFLQAYQYSQQANQLIEKASKLAAKARQIDEYPPYVQLVSALRYQYQEMNYQLAGQYFERAFAGNNHDLLLLEWYIDFLLMTAQFEKAEEIAKYMVAISPLAYSKVRAFEAFYYRGDYARAEQELANKASLLPVKRAQALSVWLALASGNEKALGKHMSKLLAALERQDLRETFVEKLNFEGQRQALGYILASVSVFTRYEKAKLYAWAGDKHEAIALLRSLVEEGDFSVRHLAIEPAFAALAEHPDFVTLVESLNL